jgi:hypothetical protein
LEVVVLVAEVALAQMQELLQPPIRVAVAAAARTQRVGESRALAVAAL